ncbi:MAG: CRISPR-associated ring nuclease Csm6 [Candidatus Xenobiia bacterium LiM19]
MSSSRSEDRQYRHTLISVSGLTPQIITETLYYFMIESNPPVPIEEIFIITTKRGKEEIVSRLLDPAEGRYYQFCREYCKDPAAIAFDEKHVILINDRAEFPLYDIRDEDDNYAAADTICQLIREKTLDSTKALHCSIAGGRKTMSVLMAFALSLYGRPQDTLSHVLVHPDFEGHREFYYIPAEPKVLKTHKGEINTKDSWIKVAFIPYVRLREKVPELWEPGGVTYSALVESTQKVIDIPALTVDVKKRRIRIGDIQITMQDNQLALYAFLAMRKEACTLHDKNSCEDCTECFVDKENLEWSTDEILTLYEQARGRKAHNEEDRKKKSSNFFSDFNPKISKINKLLKSILSDSPYLKLYTISSPDKRPSSRYGLLIDRAKITIIR